MANILTLNSDRLGRAAEGIDNRAEVNNGPNILNKIRMMAHTAANRVFGTTPTPNLTKGPFSDDEWALLSLDQKENALKWLTYRDPTPEEEEASIQSRLQH